MFRIARPVALTLLAATLGSFGPAPQNRTDVQLLAYLDPTARLSSICRGERSGGSMRAKLMIAAAAVQDAAPPAARLYDGLGNIELPVTTASPLARRYVNQGLSFTYGFNHAAAISSFRAAQRADPRCALCYWGEALAHGPNINAPMDPAVTARAVGLARYAHWLAGDATSLERALTGAMLKRYSTDPEADRAALDAAYADAMIAVADEFPTNDDIALLAAEAAMNTRPWDYWTSDNKPQPRIADAVRLTQTVLSRNPDHPQAAHLYIHLLENGPDPSLAEAAADRLARPLAPTAGHLVHMPSHIYYRLGRWKDSIRVNIDAARADERWIRESGDRGMVRYGYYPHNVHFIVTSAQMAGDMGTAMREARKLSNILDPAISAKIGWVQAINAAPYFAAAQFAPPRQILAMGAPDRRLPYAVAMRHYARAVAFAMERNRREFERELAAVTAIRNGKDLQPMVDQGVPAPDLLRLAEKVARARWAYGGGQYRAAVDLYRDAVRIEAAIPYMEPPFWYYPVHQSLGAALLRAGRAEEAAEAFNAALARSPNNGWALFGLAAAERVAGRRAHSAAAAGALKRNWMGDPTWLRLDRL